MGRSQMVRAGERYHFRDLLKDAASLSYIWEIYTRTLTILSLFNLSLHTTTRVEVLWPIWKTYSFPL